MANMQGPVCRLCRREGMKLYLKGTRCYSPKCPIEKKRQAPGQHGTLRRKMSDYGLHLREKQKARRVYGVLERQFVNYFEKADRSKGVTGETLLQLLERRLDNVVYRLGFAGSRAEARQLVRHGHFNVNGHRVDVPSYLVRANDVIAAREKSRSSAKFKALVENANPGAVPEWLSANHETLQGTVLRLPTREDIDTPVQESLIVEHYSR